MNYYRFSAISVFECPITVIAADNPQRNSKFPGKHARTSSKGCRFRSLSSTEKNLQNTAVFVEKSKEARAEKRHRTVFLYGEFSVILFSVYVNRKYRIIVTNYKLRILFYKLEHRNGKYNFEK
jgi:hypothetical protein